MWDINDWDSATERHAILLREAEEWRKVEALPSRPGQSLVSLALGALARLRAAAAGVGGVKSPRPSVSRLPDGN